LIYAKKHKRGYEYKTGNNSTNEKPEKPKARHGTSLSLALLIGLEKPGHHLKSEDAPFPFWGTSRA